MEYFVSFTHGDDQNDGTSWNVAKRTLPAATALLMPGDTLYIEGSPCAYYPDCVPLGVID
jgi:hypothetical protein